MKLRLGILGLLVVLLVLSTGTGSHAGALKGPAVSNLDSLLIDLPLPADRAYRRDVIFHDSLSTTELLQLRDGIETYRHVQHHVTVFVLRGATRVTLGTEKHKLPAGSMINIPMNTSYSFHNLGNVPSVLVFVYSPRFSGKDRIIEN